MPWRKPAFGLALAVAAWFSAVAADLDSLPFVSPMFGDNMVLQRGKPNTLWGWSKPGDVIRVEISGHTAKAVAGADSRWQAPIKPPAAGGPYTVKIDGAQHVELHEILVGDVWLRGGQSNMELPLGHASNGSNEVAAANHPEIRFFKVQSHTAYSPAAVCYAWQSYPAATLYIGAGLPAVPFQSGN